MALADGKSLDLRVSDAERDAVASELGQHFQDGRLDQAEYDERLTAAMTAKTQRDLDELLTDLPQAPAGPPGWAASEADQAGAPEAAPWRSAPPGLTRGRPRVLALLPLLIAAVVIGGMLTGGWQHGWPFAPFGLLWLIVPILVVRTWVRGGRRRQWR
jgi:hypothetical protein